MASTSRLSNGRRIIQYASLDGNRRTIHLGKMTQRNADSIKTRVELILQSQFTRRPLDAETAEWLGEIDNRLHAKLARVGLVPARATSNEKGQISKALGPYLDYYFSIRTDVKATTLEVWGHTKRTLIEFFGEAKLIDEITAGDAEEWRLFLKGKVAETTLRKRCQFAKQFFRHAERKGLMRVNPFADLKSGNLANPKRYHFLSRSDAQKVLDACPDANWRLLFALARFGGLRVPSEPALLKWEDVNWEHSRITITSPKTEHHEGGDSRVIPLFPELRPYLEDRLELEPDSVYVLPKSIRFHSNPGTMLRKIIKRAGLKPWPKIWQNLRSTRQTELSELFPSHVVCAWIGNSEDVAKLHYLQVTDDHFQRAAHFEALQNALQQPSAIARNTSEAMNTTEKKTAEFVGLANSFERLRCTKAEEGGFEPPVGLHPLRFSRPVQSAALPPLRG